MILDREHLHPLVAAFGVSLAATGVATAFLGTAPELRLPHLATLAIAVGAITYLALVVERMRWANLALATVIGVGVVGLLALMATMIVPAWSEAFEASVGRSIGALAIVASVPLLAGAWWLRSMAGETPARREEFAGTALGATMVAAVFVPRLMLLVQGFLGH